MDLLTAVLVMCVTATDGKVDCDIRVREATEQSSMADCIEQVKAIGERIHTTYVNDPENKGLFKRFDYNAKCYLEPMGSQVVANIPAYMELTGATYTITKWVGDKL